MDLDASDGYNPFAYIRSDNDIIKLVTNLMNNTRPKDSHSNDPFWDSALSLYFQAIMSYVWYECPKQGKKSYAYQVEQYLGIFRESKVFPRLRNIDDRFLFGTKELGSYLCKYSNGNSEVFPVFALDEPECISAGGHTLTRYPICGYLENGNVYTWDDGNYRSLFRTENWVAKVIEPVL